jgi:hypothetical protein
MLLVRSYRSVDRTLSEGLSDRYEFVFELGGLVTDCRDRDRIFELVALVHVPVLAALSDVSGREGKGQVNMKKLKAWRVLPGKTRAHVDLDTVRFPLHEVECDDSKK